MLWFRRVWARPGAGYEGCAAPHLAAPGLPASHGTPASGRVAPWHWHQPLNDNWSPAANIPLTVLVSNDGPCKKLRNLQPFLLYIGNDGSSLLPSAGGVSAPAPHGRAVTFVIINAQRPARPCSDVACVCPASFGHESHRYFDPAAAYKRDVNVAQVTKGTEDTGEEGRS